MFAQVNHRSEVGLAFQNALIRIGQGSLGGILQEFVLRRLTPHLRHHGHLMPSSRNAGRSRTSQKALGDNAVQQLSLSGTTQDQIPDDSENT